MGSILKDQQFNNQKGLIHTSKGPLILLFFDGYDLKAREGFIGQIHSLMHHQIRNGKRSFCKQQSFTGFYSAFLGLVKSLEAVGCDVRVNDFKLARKHPDYPIGVAGFPSVLDIVDLPNPKIFGPGDFGLPDQSQRVTHDPSFKKLIQPCEWFTKIYQPFCGDKMLPWFAGIDCEKLTDLSHYPKQFDFLLYDKIHWDREQKNVSVTERIKAYLDKRGLTYTSVRYGHHHFSQFVEGLKSSRALLYISEHETQGLAYQEALASNIPVLAWNEQKIIDPELAKYNTSDLQVSSVPYFDSRCGMTFKIENFESVCDQFIGQMSAFKPREYAQSTLSLKIAGHRYLLEYQAITNEKN
ncbi:glycosyltransferase family 1 protein [Vibrio sp. YMD68]|uniref:glycosyltransferase n=1 Tax=Vibrio sp. YMD68 TaxID=3042300 RepID=UPI00249C2CB5|nr:glycosyltransferase family 1 protein [Vibrio sp. YMD68]WGV98426.1 glycosyltransferase family 1 protein [Vibrio sp. YMD68]